MKISLDDPARTFASRIGALVGQNLDGCYQCGKCTAGCPVAYTMDYSPHEIIRLVQLGRTEVLDSHTIWLCASCETCTSRCPKNIDVAGVMDALRVSALREGREAEEEITLFHKLFLKVVERFGRVNDLQLMGRYNLFSFHPLRDWRLGRKLFAKGKLKLSGSGLKSVKEFREIVQRTRAAEGEKP
jgi:heterodisulfide reductase subunit C2